MKGRERKLKKALGVTLMLGLVFWKSFGSGLGPFAVFCGLEDGMIKWDCIRVGALT